MLRSNRTIIVPQKVQESREQAQRGKRKNKKTLDLDLSTTNPSIEQSLQNIEEENEIRQFFNEDITNPNNDVFDDLYIPNDDINKELEDIIIKMGDFLPEGFQNGVAQMEIKPQKKEEPKKITKDKLIAGDYHSKGSKSDKNIASTIKAWTNNLPSFKQYKDDNDLTWITEQHRHLLLEILHHVHNKDLRLTTLKGHINAIIRMFTLQYKSTYPLREKYYRIIIDIGEMVNKSEGDNVLNPIEQGRFVEWDNVVQERIKLENIYNSYKNKNSKEAYSKNQDLILLSLYSLIPPLRNEVKNLYFQDNDKRTDIDYVYFKDENTGFLELNLEKKRHKYIRLPLPDRLFKILKDSFLTYPRLHVFTNINKWPDISKKASEDTVAERLSKIFFKYGVKVGSNTLRSSFISDLFGKHQLTYNQREEIARQMRTSQKQLLLSYQKITSIPAEIVEGEEQGEPIQVPAQQAARKFEDNESPYQKQLERNRKYYKKNSKKVLDRQKQQRKEVPAETRTRRRIINLLNRDPVYATKIKQETIKKYNIKQENGQYV
jgi:hypothetical protein